MSILLVLGVQAPAEDATNLWAQSLSVVIHDPDKVIWDPVKPADDIPWDDIPLENIAAKLNRMRQAIVDAGGQDVPILVDSKIAVREDAGSSIKITDSRQ